MEKRKTDWLTYNHIFISLFNLIVVYNHVFGIDNYKKINKYLQILYNKIENEMHMKIIIITTD